MLHDYHEAIEVDLLRIGVDILDFWRGDPKLSARRLSLLINHLGVESELAVAMNPDVRELRTWRPTDYILADLFDITWAAHFKKAKPYPRAADAIARRRQESNRYAALQAQAARTNARLATQQALDLTKGSEQ